MIILHICNLNGNRSAGPTINVPKNIIYGNNYEKVGLYNCSDYELEGILHNNLFTIAKYKNISSLPFPFNKPDIVVFHGIYIKHYIKVYYELRIKKIPYIIVPRGSLTAAAQNKKGLKKVIGNFLFFNKFVKNAETINFLTDNEHYESKKFRFKNYYINGNGIEIPKNHKKYGSKKRNNFVITFIGRIEWYHKGLDILIEAINYKKEDFRTNNIIFNLYGPDDFNSLKKLNEIIDKYKINDLIKIKKPIFDKEKEQVLLDSDLFIHTSRLEGQPTSVIEAISYGVPVFVTPGTNILKLVKNNKLGYVSEFDYKKIAEGLLNAYQDKKNHHVISKNELLFSEKNFNWNIIVKRNIKEYNKIISNME